MISTTEHKKEIISNKLLSCLMDIEGVISVSIVGSFCDKDNLSCISDIDTIVICNHLTKEIYDRCLQTFQRLHGRDIGIPERSIYVNPTFGPLKYDNDDLIVIHLMIYDVQGHRRHVLESPFTCYDWERSQIVAGPSLKQIYPVLKLQPRDFIRARRGLTDYLNDLEKKVISFRRYYFHRNSVQEVLDYKRLDSRHQGEYAFHIAKNLVVNYLKMILQDNILFSTEELYEYWKRYLPDCAYFIPFFKDLYSIKCERRSEFPHETITKVKVFVLRFEQQFKKFWYNCSKLKFIRHGPTHLNDGSYLGISRDPELLDNVEIPCLDDFVSRFFCSPLKRAKQTAQIMASGATITEDDLLAEIDYGRAEGLTYPEMQKQFPEIIEGWNRGDDVCFPGGENTDAVYKRLQSFLDEHKMDNNVSLIVTHNVVLRCLTGSLYGINQEQWHKLEIPHLEVMDVVCKDGRVYPNYNTKAKAAITDSLVRSL
jgi:broad specificity phosphatase PhoE